MRCYWSASLIAIALFTTAMLGACAYDGPRSGASEQALPAAEAQTIPDCPGFVPGSRPDVVNNGLTIDGCSVTIEIVSGPPPIDPPGVDVHHANEARSP